MEMDGMMGSMGLWMLLWAAVGIAVLTVLVLVAVRLLRGGGDSGDSVKAIDPAEHILRQRYAAGEITHDEYLAQSETLRRGHS